jgi:hypothetical protein
MKDGSSGTDMGQNETKSILDLISCPGGGHGIAALFLEPLVDAEHEYLGDELSLHLLQLKEDYEQRIEKSIGHFVTD